MHGRSSLERCKEREPEKERKDSVLLTNWLCLEVGWQADLTHALAIDSRQPHRVGCFRFQASDSNHALHICFCRNKKRKSKEKVQALGQQQMPRFYRILSHVGQM